jgi:hypothetical protein
MTSYHRPQLSMAAGIHLGYLGNLGEEILSDGVITRPDTALMYRPLMERGGGGGGGRREKK